jgi:DNA repair exonuclease SbcCD ATPase subunit
MRLQFIDIENFMSFLGHTHIGLEHLGLVHISGLNGAGKTTLYEALTWCFFGEGLPRPAGNSTQGIRAAEVLNDSLGKQCRVDVGVYDEEKKVSLVVGRWRKWNPAKSSKSIELRGLVKDKSRQSNGQRLRVADQVIETLDESETNRLIGQHLGITWDIWCRGVIFGQESTFNFCESTSLKRQNILTTVRGLEMLDDWKDRCRTEKNQLGIELAELGGRQVLLTQTLEATEKEDPKRYVDEWERQRRVKLTELKKRQEELTKDAQTYKQKIKEMGEEYSESAPVGGADEGPLNRIKKQIEDAQKAVSVAFANQQVVNSAISVKSRDIQKIEQMRPGVQCPSCLNFITDKHKGDCLLPLQAERIQLQQRAVLAAGELKQQESILEGLKAQQRELEIIWQNDLEANRAWERRVQDWERQRQQLDHNVQMARQQWRQFKTQIQDCSSVENPHIQAVDRWKEKLNKLREDQQNLEVEHSCAIKKLEICKWWDKEFPRLKTWIFDDMVGALSAEANRWLKIMSGGTVWVQVVTQVQKGKTIKDDLEVFIFRWNPDGSITKRPYRLWSGGEKRGIALSVDLGLSSLMASRASKHYKFLGLDEVDRHLDGPGRERLRAVLEDLKRERETCLIVTHDPEFKASFDKHFFVRKENGQSFLELTDGSQARKSEAEKSKKADSSAA